LAAIGEYGRSLLTPDKSLWGFGAGNSAVTNAMASLNNGWAVRFKAFPDLEIAEAVDAHLPMHAGVEAGAGGVARRRVHGPHRVEQARRLLGGRQELYLDGELHAVSVDEFCPVNKWRGGNSSVA
jgi:hypothetical protein